MAEPVCSITDQEIDAALERASRGPDMPGAIAVQYHSALDAIAIKLNGGRRLLLPRRELQGLESATEGQLSQIEIHAGVGISWPLLDVDHYLPSLMSGQYGSSQWMKELERRGVADTPNNSGHAIAKLKTSYAMYPIMAPHSLVCGEELRTVTEIYRDTCLSELVFTFHSGNFIVRVIDADDTIDLLFDREEKTGLDVSSQEPWNGLVGTKAAWSWLGVNQNGYLDTILLSFGNVVLPEVVITAVASELKVSALSPVGKLATARN